MLTSVQSTELHIYTDFLRIVLEILNAILSYALPRNPEVVYAILHRQEVFLPFKDHPRFTELLENINTGYVGNKSAVFPLQLLRYDVDPINSVQFSNHTGCPTFKGQVLVGQQLWDLIEGLSANNLLYYTHLLTGLRTGSIYYDLQILESIFDQGTGAPSKQKIKEITQKLSHHGQISESNVYNWFQNRRARSKRKQTATTQINSESEAEADLASPNEKMAKIVGVNPYEKLPRRLDNLPRPCSETSSEVSSTDQETNRAQNISMLNDNSNSCEMSFYENFLSNPRSSQLEF